MKLLYIDCFSGFTTEMLFGALIDMGAPKGYIEEELKKSGFEAEIIADTVKRGDMDCVSAYVKCHSKEYGDKKENFKNFLKLQCMEEEFLKANNFIGSVDTEILCMWLACLYAIESFQIDAVICSDVNEGCVFLGDDIKPISPNSVYRALKRYNIPTNILDVSKELITLEGVIFLGEVADKFGILPLSQVNCVGYGAGDTDIEGCVNIIRTVIADTEEDFSLLKELKEEMCFA